MSMLADIEAMGLEAPASRAWPGEVALEDMPEDAFREFCRAHGEAASVWQAMPAGKPRDGHKGTWEGRKNKLRDEAMRRDAEAARAAAEVEVAPE
jgi:hypothetical protein